MVEEFPAYKKSAGDHRQDDIRSPLPVNENLIASLAHVGCPTLRFSGIKVEIEVREIAAGNVQADPVPHLK